MGYTEDNLQSTATNAIDSLSKVVESGSKFVQLATDATRLLSKTDENIQEIKNTSFFKRIRELFTKNKKNDGEVTKTPVVHQTMVVQSSDVSKEEFFALQEFARQSLEVLNERNLLTADALITVKNNLNTLDVKQQEIKEAVIVMAKKVSDRFNRLENRLDELENAHNLLVWLTGIDFDEEYKKLPETIRFLKVIRDFYNRKKTDYSREHLLLIRKAMDSVGLDYKKEISLGNFVDMLVDELQDFDEGKYLEITKINLGGNCLLSADELSDLLAVPSFAAVTQMTESKNKLKDTILLLEKEYNLPYSEALKKSIKNDIAMKNGIDMNVKMTMGDLGVELLSCYSAIPDLVEDLKPKTCKHCGKEIKFVEFKVCPFCGADWRTGKIG